MSEQNIAEEATSRGNKRRIPESGLECHLYVQQNRKRVRLVTEYSSPLAVKGKKVSTGISPYDLFYQKLHKTILRCGAGVVGYLKIRDTEVATFNGSDAETDELTDGMDQDPDEADDEDIQNDIKLLRKLLNKKDKHSLSHKQMKHVRVLLITSRRYKMLEIVQEVILGDQSRDGTVVFDESFTSDVVASYDTFEHNFRHANDWAYKFDLILTYTYTIDVYDAWKYDFDFDWSKTNFLPSLLRKWKKVLTKSNSEIGIHKLDGHTRIATEALLDKFRKSFDNDSVHSMLSLQKWNGKKIRKANTYTTSAEEVSSDEELSSSEYTTYKDYIPWTHHNAILHRQYIELGDKEALASFTGRSNWRKKSKKAAMSAPIKPKKPFNPYMLFNNDMRAQVKADCPNLKPNEISRKMGELWRELSDKDKVPYIQKYGKQKATYNKKKAEWERQMAVYRKSNIHGSCIGECSDSNAVDPNDTLRKEIMKTIVPRYIELKTKLGETHPKVLSIRMIIQQYNLLEYSTELEMQRGERHNRKKLPPAKNMLNRRIQLADPDGEMFPGTITHVRKGTSKAGAKGVILVRVLYDDGETDTDLDLTTEEFSWLEESSSPEDEEDG